MYRVKDESASKKTNMILELVKRTFNLTIDDKTRKFLFDQIKSNIKSVELEEWPKRILPEKIITNQSETTDPVLRPIKNDGMIDFHGSK